MKATTGKALGPRSAAMIFGFALSAPGAMAGALLLAPLWAVVGALAAPWRSLPDTLRRRNPALVLFLAFFVWAQLSMLWAPRYDFEIASHMAGGFITGLLLLAAFAHAPSTPESALVRQAAIVFAFAAMALGFIEIFGKVPIARMFQPEGRVDLLLRGPMKGVNVLVTALPGIAAMMWALGARARYALAVLVVGVGVLAANSNMYANNVGFTLGILGFGAGLHFKHHAFRSVAFLVAALILFSPAVFTIALHFVPSASVLPESWEQRVLIWRSALNHIAAHPLFGTGFGTLRETALSGALGANINAQHTHNAGLHLWFETGFVGAALATGALCALALQSAKGLRNQPVAAAAATGAIAAVAPFAFVSWSVWQEWWVATIFLAAGLAVAIPRNAAQPPPQSQTTL